MGAWSHRRTRPRRGYSVEFETKSPRPRRRRRRNADSAHRKLRRACIVKFWFPPGRRARERAGERHVAEVRAELRPRRRVREAPRLDARRVREAPRRVGPRGVDLRCLRGVAPERAAALLHAQRDDEVLLRLERLLVDGHGEVPGAGALDKTTTARVGGASSRRRRGRRADTPRRRAARTAERSGTTKSRRDDDR